MASSVHPARAEELPLAREAKGREQQLQQQYIQLQSHMRWPISQAPPNGSVPAATTFSYAGRPLEPVLQAGHQELP
jgi:hypothetical protein